MKNPPRGRHRAADSSTSDFRSTTNDTDLSISSRACKAFSPFRRPSALEAGR
jgi:hypothetical protein